MNKIKQKLTIKVLTILLSIFSIATSYSLASTNIINRTLLQRASIKVYCTFAPYIEDDKYCKSLDTSSTPQQVISPVITPVSSESGSIKPQPQVQTTTNTSIKEGISSQSVYSAPTIITKYITQVLAGSQGPKGDTGPQGPAGISGSLISYNNVAPGASIGWVGGNYTVNDPLVVTGLSANYINANTGTINTLNVSHLNVPNTLSSNSNIITSDIGGSVSSTTIINSNIATSSVNSLYTIINGATSTIANIINSNNVTAVNGIIASIVNGVTATTSVGDLLHFMASSTNSNLTVATDTLGNVIYSFTDNPIFNTITSTTTNSITLNSQIVNASTTNSINTNSNISNSVISNSQTSNSSTTNSQIVNSNLVNSQTVNASTTNSDGLLANNATVTNALISNADIINGTSTNWFSNIVTAITGYFSDIFTQNLIASSATTTNLYASNANFVGATTTSLFSSLLNSVTGYVTDLVSQNATTTNLSAASATLGGTTLTSVATGSATSAVLIISPAGLVQQIDPQSLLASNTVNMLSVSTSTNSYLWTSVVNGVVSSVSADIINSNSLNASGGVITSVVNGVTATTSVNDLYTFLASSANSNLTVSTSTDGTVTYEFTNDPTFNTITATTTNSITLNSQIVNASTTNSDGLLVTDATATNANITNLNTTDLHAINSDLGSTTVNGLHINSVPFGFVTSNLLVYGPSGEVEQITPASMLLGNTTNLITLATGTNGFIVTSDVNGVSSSANAEFINSNIATSSGNIFSSIINGVAAFADIITGNSLSFNGTSLTSSVNGVSTTTSINNFTNLNTGSFIFNNATGTNLNLTGNTTVSGATVFTSLPQIPLATGYTFVGNASGNAVGLAPGTTGQILTSTGTTSAPTWQSYDFDAIADARIALQKAQINGLASLDATGKVPLSQIPATVFGNTWIVGTLSDCAAVSGAIKGDICIATSTSHSYVLANNPYSTLSNWTEILQPASPVTSVNSQIGNVTLTASNGLNVVGNTDFRLGGSLASNTNINQNTNQMTFTGSGALGIGTASPSARLHVSGSTRLDLGGDATGDLYFRSAGGNVGALAIGTSNQVLQPVGGIPAWTNTLNVTNVNATNTTTTGLKFTNLTSASPATASTSLFLTVDALGNVILATSTASAAACTPSSTTFCNNGNALASNLTLGTNDNFAQIFKTNNVERVRITNAGNVGIGTNTPLATLHTKNAAILGGAPATTGTSEPNLFQRMEANTATFDSGFLNNGTVWQQARNVGNFATNYNLSFNPNGGNVGVGTTAPNYKLEVVNNATTSASFARTDNLAGNQVGVSFGTNNTTYMDRNAFVRGVEGSGIDQWSLAFGTSNSNATAVERMRITNTGNVGIATTTPGYTFTVAGTPGTANTQIQSLANNTTASIASGSGLLIADSLGIINRVATGTLASSLCVGSTSVFCQNGNTFGANAALGTNDNFAQIFKTNNVERMRIDNLGNIGIGTTAPSTKLQVNSGTSGDSGLLIQQLRYGVNTPNNGATTSTTTYAIGVDSVGKVYITNALGSLDSRAANYLPQERNAGAYFDFKNNSADGLSDGGTYHGVQTFRPYGTNADFTGGPAYQLGFTSNNGTNGNLWIRSSASSTGWNSWEKILDGNSGWSTTGNASTTAGTNFIGTTDDQALVFKVNNIERLRMATDYTFQTPGGVALSFGNNNVIATTSVLVNFGVGNINNYVNGSTFGRNNIVNGAQGTAIGYGNNASNTDATAVGRSNIVIGAQASAFGYSNNANGLRAVSLGYGNTANDVDAVAVGRSNIATNTASAFGYGNSSTGIRSVSIGNGNIASSTDSVAFGRGNISSGAQSTVIGYSNTASGDQSFAGGYSSTATNTRALALGYGNNAREVDTTAVGRSNNSNATGSQAIGYGNTSSGVYSSAFGISNTAAGDNSSSFGRSNNVTVYATNSSAFGYSNTVQGYNSGSYGYSNNVQLDSNNSFLFGESNTTQQGSIYSYAFGRSNTLASSTIASGGSAFAFGISNTVRSSNNSYGSYARGYGNNIGNLNATNTYLGFADGWSNTINGAGGMAIGNGNNVYSTLTSGSALLIGQNNNGYDIYSGAAAIGNNNTIRRLQYAFGQTNNLGTIGDSTIYNNTAIGTSNVVGTQGVSTTTSVYYNTVIGTSNTVGNRQSTNYTSVSGSSNVVDGRYSSVAGYGNNINGYQYNNVDGFYNIVNFGTSTNSYYNNIFGRSNTISGDNVRNLVTIGSVNTIAPLAAITDNVVLGRNNIVTSSSTMSDVRIYGRNINVATSSILSDIDLFGAGYTTTGVERYSLQGGWQNNGATSTDSQLNWRISNWSGQASYVASAPTNNTANRFGIGLTNPSSKLHASTTENGNYAARFENFGNNTTSHGILVRGGGNVSTTTGSNLVAFLRNDGTQIGSIQQNAINSVQYLTTSDARRKTNITDSVIGLEDLMKVKVHDYNWIGDEGSVKTNGFLAQELYDIYPDAVSKPIDESTANWAVDYGRLTPMIVKSIQDLNNKISTNATNGTLDMIAVLRSASAQGMVEIVGDIQIGGHIIASGDIGGRATIISGGDKVSVSFARPYIHTPIVNITPRDFIGGLNYKVTNESVNGFDIVINGNYGSDISFNWMAIDVDITNTSNSNNTSAGSVTNPSAVNIVTDNASSSIPVDATTTSTSTEVIVDNASTTPTDTQ